MQQELFSIDERHAKGGQVQAVVSPLPLGTETPFGKVQAVGITGGERYYWLIAQDGSVSMMPAFIIEKAG